MTSLDMIDRFTEFGKILAEVLIFGLAVTAYNNTRKRSLLFIAISCGISAVFGLGYYVLDGSTSWFRWGAYTLAVNLSSVLWVLGSWLLFRHYVGLVGPGAQPGAPPSGGPGGPVADSGASGRPPSVS